MFVQVIEGRVADRERLRSRFESWRQELMAGAPGFLGSTALVADDGEYVAFARFSSEQVARANSARDEQGAWWKETETCFDEVRFRDSSDVEVLGPGGSDAARFVQVLRGRSTDPERLRSLATRISPALEAQRSDFLGSLRVWHAGGEFTQVAYFTSEADARAGEATELDPEVQALRGEAFALIQDLRFLESRDPWLTSP